MINAFVIVALVSSLSASAIAQQKWTQAAELQPVFERGRTVDPAVPASQAIEDVVFSGGVVPKWIWGHDKDAKYVLRQSFEISSMH